ncbi:MAG: hypothetical protein M3Y08_07115 [Fibrobacterota bacterium]|nr:hypothetical protein [Fibrobacterota bacterium]
MQSKKFKVAFGVAVDHNLLGGLNHLDSTIFSVTGQYESSKPKVIEDNGEPIEVHITQGFSKDPRPDLKRVVLSMVVNGPVYLATNDLDEVSFTDEKMLREYKEQQKVENGFRFLKDPWFMVSKLWRESEWPEFMGRELRFPCVRRKIIRLFGRAACQMYGLTPKSADVGLGMLALRTGSHRTCGISLMSAQSRPNPESCHVR